ncbi:MAG: type II toxin-antitoxin system VapB family antitoxin [Oscillospiraceae bacterium]|nr:type II toxin-antitoxin system VapB family antitoxin [Oscillospiraceae bacterium]
MIKTTVDLDEKLLEKATKIFEGKTKKEIISIALIELVERHEKKNVADLIGKISFADGYNYKEMRRSPHDFS